jgi:hypothetical protein
VPAVGVPQFEQNLAPGVVAVPHSAHVVANAVPQAEQNLAPTPFSLPQTEQCTLGAPPPRIALTSGSVPDLISGGRRPSATIEMLRRLSNSHEPVRSLSMFDAHRSTCSQPFACTLAQVSLSVSVRLNTSASGRESVSGAK